MSRPESIVGLSVALAGIGLVVRVIYVAHKQEIAFRRALVERIRARGPVNRTSWTTYGGQIAPMLGNHETETLP